VQDNLKGFQKKYLKGLAHSMKPVVLIGQNGLTDTLIKAIDGELDRQELIKVKFNAIKDQEGKQTILSTITSQTGSEVVGMIGHVVILYRMNDDPEKRRITLPAR
jgi:RNA-binding protein